MRECEEGEVGLWNSPSSPFLRAARSLRTALSRKHNLLIARRRINAGRDEGGENSASPAAASSSKSILIFSFRPHYLHRNHLFRSVGTFPFRPKLAVFCYLTREGCGCPETSTVEKGLLRKSIVLKQKKTW